MIRGTSRQIDSLLTLDLVFFVIDTACPRSLSQLSTGLSRKIRAPLRVTSRRRFRRCVAGPHMLWPNASDHEIRLILWHITCTARCARAEAMSAAAPACSTAAPICEVRYVR